MPTAAFPALTLKCLARILRQRPWRDGRDRGVVDTRRRKHTGCTLSRRGSRYTHGSGRRSRLTGAIFGLVLTCALVATACGGPARQVRGSCPPCANVSCDQPAAVKAAATGGAEVSARQLKARYRQAVKDASQAEPHEIFRDLWPVTRHNKNLRWKSGAAGERVLAVTWTGWSGYDDKVGQQITLSREVWLTLAPQLANFCKQRIRPGDKATLRLEQLLGLPPGNGKDRFVELWVHPDDLFRPSPDPEVTDSQAEVDFPRSTRFVAVSEEHRRWIEKLTSSSYGAGGYPWTRLGYTYDWGNPDSEVGLSEVVVRGGAAVEIKAVTKNSDYCQPGGR